MSRTSLVLAGLLAAFSLVGALWWVSAGSELEGRIERVRARADEVGRNEARHLAARVAALARERGIGGEEAAPGELALALSGASLPARLVTGAPLSPGAVRARVPATAWRVEVDARAPRAEAEEIVLKMRSLFRTSAAALAAVAFLVCFLVAFVVRQAERVARERSRFAASAAHELRTPLAGIRLYAEMLADDLGDEAKRSEYARRLAAEAARLGRVVSNVLGFSRLERGRLVVRREPGDLVRAVRECVSELEPAMTAAGARVDLVIEEPLPPAPFDRDAVAEILRNLVDNAERYGRSAADRTIHVRLAGSGTGVELSVRDHGPGIPRRAARRLFRPFRRFVPEEGPPGLGLGLTLVRSLARGHRGDVRHEPAEGGGALFCVFLSGEGSNRA